MSNVTHSQEALAARIEAIIGKRPVRLSPLGGGCVGEVFKVTFASGCTLVAKAGGALDVEGRMLAYLAHHTKLPVPEVLQNEPDLLLMSALEGSCGTVDASAQRHGAELLAELHNITTDRGFGFTQDTVIGGLAQPNPWTRSWRSFFAEHRLLYMGRVAQRAGRLPVALMSRLERFTNAIDKWIQEPQHPSLIHGDMWGGNVLSHAGRITGFIDPALYFADAEIELAFTTMFSTFGEPFFNRYTELRPIKPGFFEERREIYNLYPLLVHVRLFGGSYVGTVEHTLRRFGF